MVATQAASTTIVQAEPAHLPALTDPGTIGVFESLANFEAAQRMAKALASSTVVPKEYQGNVSNCLIAMEYAARTRASVLAVMQSLNVIHGRPAMSATFAIASVNTCGRFAEISYQWRNREQPVEQWACRAVAKSLRTGEELHGTTITWDMAKREGWTTKNGSKWQTMPEQMFRYRAATFWVRAYAPDILLGMRTTDEAEDILVEAGPPSTIGPDAPRFSEPQTGMSGLDAALGEADPDKGVGD